MEILSRGNGRGMKIVLTLLLIALTWYRCFGNLTTNPIERWDEQTNIAVIADTRSHGSFPILFLENTPFFEKSPLWYYLHLFLPVHPRVVSAFAGLLTILLTAYITWKWWGPLAGFVSWVILLTTNHLFVTNPSGIFSTHTFRSADVDSLFMFLLVASFFVDSPKWKGLLAGLAVLTKGPLGALPILFSTNKITSICWALATILPWYTYMVAQFGETFLSAHFGYHLYTRSVMPLEGHTQYWWYYASILSNRHLFFSWELLVGSMIYLFATKKLKDSRIRSIVIMAATLLLVPTFVQTKLAWYILPFYPFAALVIAAGVSAAIFHYHKYTVSVHRK